MTRFSYANPPIIEAVLSIGFNVSEGIDLPVHEDAIRQRCSEDYPNISRDFQNEFKVESGEHPQSKSTVSQLGFCFVNAKKTQVFRIHKDEFFFSRLKPYENWEQFRDEAKRLFEICCEVLSVKEVTRVSVRFINRFDLPGSSVNLSEYFNVFPHVPGKFHMKSLGMQVILDQPDIGGILVINQALMPPPQPKMVSILLDLGLFNKQQRRVEDLWGFLEKLHVRKNEVFESAITNKSRELLA